MKEKPKLKTIYIESWEGKKKLAFAWISGDCNYDKLIGGVQPAPGCKLWHYSHNGISFFLPKKP